MKNKLKNVIVKLNFANILSIPLYFFRLFPIKNNRIVFENFTGKGYGDSPKYIADRLLEDGNKYELYWIVFNNTKNNFPASIKAIKIYSLKYFYILATSRIWIANSRFDQYIVKRKKQLYIQTWHGCLPLKKIEYDAEDKLSNYYKKVMKKDNKNIDIMISNSKYCTELYRRAFRYNGKILEIGCPRNDGLIIAKEKMASKVKTFYNISGNTKILLYAPTFRNDYSNNPYDIDFNRLIKELETTTKYKWKIIIKLHPRITNSSQVINISGDLIDATEYLDVQELLCACDVLVTDYSSIMFEALIANKSVIIYAKDINDYESERGYYFKFNQLPFRLAQNNDELLAIIKTKDFGRNNNLYDSFKKKLGLVETGNASNYIYKYIKDYIGGKIDE